MSTTFKIGDRVVLVKYRDSARKGMKGTVVTNISAGDYGVKFDEKFSLGHDLGGKCEFGFGHWIAPDEMELIPKFSVGQVYKVGTSGWSNNAVIKITEVKGERAKYKMLKGKNDFGEIIGFGFDSAFGKSLTLLTGKEIGEAIRNWKPLGNANAPKYNEVKRGAKVGEFIKMIGNGDGYSRGEVCKVIASGDGYGRLYIRTNQDSSFRGDAADRPLKQPFSYVFNHDYVVLEGYQPSVLESVGKAKIGDTIKVLEDNGGFVKSGTEWKVTGIRQGGTLEVSNLRYGGGFVVSSDNYVVISAGKHSYTAEQIEKAKQIVLDTIREFYNESKGSIVLSTGVSDPKTIHAYVFKKGKSSITSGAGETVWFMADNAVHGSAKCSDNDEPNEWIGKCVALCKALHKQIPTFITED